MNEKLKKVLSVVGGAFAFVFALLLGRWSHRNVSKRVSSVEDSVADGRRTVDEIRDGNSGLEDGVAEVAGVGDELAESVGKSVESVGDAEKSIGNAHDAVRFGIGVIEQIEKRNNL